jgi:hypothetical protein
MPPPVVRTIEDEIFYQYAKIISESAGFGKGNYGFIISRFKDLKSGKMEWSTSIREWIRENERPDRCVYCGSKGNLTVEHILPLSCGGPDIPDNAIRVCRHCNSGKGGKRLYEWFGLDGKNDIPRIAEGKYLKLLHRLHRERGTLHVSRDTLTAKLCPRCGFVGKGNLCDREDTVGKLDVFCLEGTFAKKR